MTIFSRPVTVRARRMAAITASEPVLQKVMRSLPVISQNRAATLPASSRLRPDGEAFVQLLPDRLHDEVGRVAEGGLAEAVDQIDVFVAVEVPQLRPGGAVDDDRIDQLLPLGAEAGGRTRVGQHGAVLLGVALRPGCLAAVASGQIVDVALLLGVSPLLDDASFGLNTAKRDGLRRFAAAGAAPRRLPARQRCRSDCGVNGCRGDCTSGRGPRRES